MIRHLRVGNGAGGDLLYAGDTFLGLLLTLGYSAADFAGTRLWHILDPLRDRPCHPVNSSRPSAGASFTIVFGGSAR